jgi:secreted trypsin-like serine protease
MRLYQFANIITTLLTMSIANAQIKLTNGNDASLKDYPWQVSLTKNKAHICGGSIISKRFIVTAAHCLTGLPNNFEIWAGGSGSRKMLSKQPDPKIFYIHHDYHQWADDIKKADIALIELNEDIAFSDTIRPIALPKSDLSIEIDSPAKYKKIAVSGWGQDQNNITPMQLKFIDNLVLLPSIKSKFWSIEENVQIIKATDYPKLYNIYETYLTGDYLGILVEEKKSFCRGDSGGPMSILTGNQNVLIGVGSHLSHIACLDTKVFYYTNVSVFIDWIKGVTNS